MKREIQQRITIDDFVMELVGTKRLLNLIKKYSVDASSDIYTDIIKKSIERLNKEI